MAGGQGVKSHLKEVFEPSDWIYGDDCHGDAAQQAVPTHCPPPWGAPRTRPRLTTGLTSRSRPLAPKTWMRSRVELQELKTSQAARQLQTRWPTAVLTAAKRPRLRRVSLLPSATTAAHARQPLPMAAPLLSASVSVNRQTGTNIASRVKPRRVQAHDRLPLVRLLACLPRGRRRRRRRRRRAGPRPGAAGRRWAPAVASRGQTPGPSPGIRCGCVRSRVHAAAHPHEGGGAAAHPSPIPAFSVSVIQAWVA